MAKCPWPPCGAELGPLEADKSITLDHPQHKLWAADPYHEYLVVDREDGTRDVFKVKKGEEADRLRETHKRHREDLARALEETPPREEVRPRPRRASSGRSHS